MLLDVNVNSNNLNVQRLNLKRQTICTDVTFGCQARRSDRWANRYGCMTHF